MVENLLTYSIGSLFWGIIIAVACIVLLLFLIKCWRKDAGFSPLSYVIVAVLGLILVFNCTTICSALAMKSDIGVVESLIDKTIKFSYANYEAIVDEETSEEILQGVFAQNPILNLFVDTQSFEGVKLTDLPHVIADAFRSSLKKLIVRRILWSLAFIVIGVLLVAQTLDKSGNDVRKRSVNSRNSHERISSRRRRSNIRR